MTHILKLITLLTFTVLLAGCATSKNATLKKADKQSEELIEYAYKYINTPYRSGGTTPKGFDCSGYVQFVYKKIGYAIPRSTDEQIRIGLDIKRTKIKKGDLVFFKNRNQTTKKAGHVGIVVSVSDNGKFRFIHSSTIGGVVIDDIEHSYYKSRYICARRVIL